MTIVTYMQLYIGTSGYDYPEWKGEFYPQDLKRADFLAYYATIFNALELNFSFYGMPVPEKMLSFYERTDGKVVFSVKANQLLTHKIDGNWRNYAEDFKNAVKPLLEKGVLGAVLFQFPESFHYTKENRIYLAMLVSAFDGFPVVVEFRHKEWIKDTVFMGLESYKASLCFCDMPRLKNLPDGTLLDAPFVGNIAYVRLHGRNAEAWYASEPENGTEPETGSNGSDAGSESGSTGASGGQNGSERYKYDYSADELVQFVPVINTAINAGKKVHVYFNNHPCGFGAKNAKLFKDMMQWSNLQII